MQDSGFMETIYHGRLDQSAFYSFQDPLDRPRVDRILTDFQGIMKDFPATTIEELGRVPDEMLKRLAAAGLFGLTIPEAYGGAGLNLWEYMHTVERMAGYDLSAALVSLAHLSIGTKGIVLFGTDQQKERYLPAAARGQMIFSYALTEPKIGSDAKHIETTAVLGEDGEHYLLHGRKTYITNANYAGGLTVFAQMDPKRPGRLGAFIVETAWDGVKIGKDMPKMGLKASSTAAIQFDNVRVPKANLLGNPGDGFKIAMTILNYGRLGLGAASVGMMERSTEDMVKRARTRIQFGLPIASFPLIQEKIARAKVHAFVSRAMNTFAAALLNDDPIRNVAIESSHCKLFGTTRAWDTLYDALQVAGGAGYLGTNPYEKRMRDFRVTTIFEGTTEIHSIYPALFAFRRLAREAAALKGNRRGQLASIWNFVSCRMDWPLAYRDKTLKRAARLARANARTIRWMLLLGPVLHKKDLAKREFYLRRLSTLSLFTYGILAVLAKIQEDRRIGRNDEQGPMLLEYFLDEAREARRINRSYRESARERLTSAIADSMK